jgi:acetate kinase
MTLAGLILVVNAGSSSIKFSAYTRRDEQELALSFRGQVESVGSTPHMMAKDANGATLADERWPSGPKSNHEAVLELLMRWTETHLGGRNVVAVGHRVVHGGTTFAGPTRVDKAVLAMLDSLSPLAPLHQPHNLAAIRAIATVAPSLPQVVCFDTAFHHDQSPLAQRFALPRALHEAGVRRYGFHGLSYEYIASALRARVPAVSRGRVIVAHLGAGASLCAMRDGKSVDTTMGFTALDGLPMATRCGALDPGVILYLLRERGMNADAVEDLLYHRSGLLGVSGISGDMRELLASEATRAKEAVDLFVYRICREIGALAATLDGLDGLVFTAGIGERSPEIRRMICERSRWLGVRLDLAANERSEECISAPDSRVSVWAIPTDEELMIVHHTIRVLGISDATPSFTSAGATP